MVTQLESCVDSLTTVKVRLHRSTVRRSPLAIIQRCNFFCYHPIARALVSAISFVNGDTGSRDPIDGLALHLEAPKSARPVSKVRAQTRLLIRTDYPRLCSRSLI